MRQWIRRAALGVAVLRVGLGVVAVVRPGLVARPWVGSSHATPAGEVLGRAAGARDIALGAGVLLTSAHADGRAARELTTAAAFCDAVDALTTVTAWQRLPGGWRALVLATAAGAATVGALSAAAGPGTPAR